MDSKENEGKYLVFDQETGALKIEDYIRDDISSYTIESNASPNLIIFLPEACLDTEYENIPDRIPLDNGIEIDKESLEKYSQKLLALKAKSTLKRLESKRDEAVTIGDII